MPNNDNPLARFFRQPAIYIRLPSNGKTWPAGTLDLPSNGELPVFPMTAIDEITYRTPDALFNGEAVVSVIQSCVPNIKDAWSVPSTDLDTILVGIRIASYGHEMEIDTSCPACKNESLFGLDLRTIIDKIGSADYSQPLMLGDLQITFKPLDYRQITENSQLQFEQQKTMQALNADGVNDEDSKIAQINAMMKRIVEVTIHAIAQSIVGIRTPDALVTDVEQIEEFLAKCDRALFTKIRDHAVALREKTEMKPLKIRCINCQHDYEQLFTLDLARFFVPAS